MTAPERHRDLRSKLRDDEPDYQTLASGGEAIFPELEQAAHDDDPLIAARALHLLAEIDSARAVPVLLYAMDRSSASVRVAALSGLSDYLQKAADRAKVKAGPVKGLLALESKVGAVLPQSERVTLQIALTRIADAVVSEKDSSVRYLAVQSLAEFIEAGEDAKLRNSQVAAEDEVARRRVSASGASASPWEPDAGDMVGRAESYLSIRRRLGRKRMRS